MVKGATCICISEHVLSVRKGHENGVPQVWKLDEMLRLQWSSEKFYARGDFVTKPNPSTWLLLNFGFGIQ